jgi:hypothetical protein
MAKNLKLRDTKRFQHHIYKLQNTKYASTKLFSNISLLTLVKCSCGVLICTVQKSWYKCGRKLSINFGLISNNAPVLYHTFGSVIKGVLLVPLVLTGVPVGSLSADSSEDR